MVTTTRFQQVFDKAMALSPDERLELVELLLGARDESVPGWWASVKPEMDRQLAEIDSGEAKTLSWDEVRKRMYERLNAGRD